MISPLLITSTEDVIKILKDSSLSSEYIKFTPRTWIPSSYCLQSIEPSSPTDFHEEQSVLFEIKNVDLPTAAQRWKISLPEHPEITFEDLRAGKWPKPTEEELKAREEALKLAQRVQEILDIRPLTTTILIRQLREGKEGSG